jgi:hypothetical protein
MNNQKYTNHLKNFLLFLRITQRKIAHVLIMSFLLQAASPFVTQATTPVTVPMQTSPPIEAAVIRHTPVIQNRVEGSVRQLLPETFKLENAAIITGDLYVPGAPTVVKTGAATYTGTFPGTGSATPTNYQIQLNGSAKLGKLITRTDAIAMPVVTAPPATTNTRDVTLSAANQSAGNWATVRDLKLEGVAGNVTVPAGTYRNFTVASGTRIVLGIAGATIPSVYNLNDLVVKDNAAIIVNGLVTLNVGTGVKLEGSGFIGNSANPGWLTINNNSGDVKVSGDTRLYGTVNAPNSKIVIEGSSIITGKVWADNLTVSGGAKLTGVNFNQPLPASLTSIAPSTGNQGQTITVTLTGANTTWNGTTQASFGAETSVGGAAYGQLGTINVTSATTATAQVAISPTAALEPRSVTVVTGTETVTLSNVFFVKPATPPSMRVMKSLSRMQGTTGFAK